MSDSAHNDTNLLYKHCGADDDDASTAHHLARPRKPDGRGREGEARRALNFEQSAPTAETNLLSLISYCIELF